MAVTCSFTRKLGYLWIRDHNGKPTRCDVWAGGNCMMVVTYGKGRSLQTFFSDMAHLRRCAKDDWFKHDFAKAEISIDLGYAKEIAATFAKAGVPITLFPSGHKFK